MAIPAFRPHSERLRVASPYTYSGTSAHAPHSHSYTILTLVLSVRRESLHLLLSSGRSSYFRMVLLLSLLPIFVGADLVGADLLLAQIL